MFYFCLPDSQKQVVCLKDVLQKYEYVVLYFYPKDDTPGCTTESIEFSSLKKEFEKLNTLIIGVSADSCESHEKFSLKHNLGILLLSDENKEVIKAYNAWGKKSFMGKVFEGIIRKTFLISKKGIINEWPNVNPKGHADQVLNYIKLISKND